MKDVEDSARINRKYKTAARNLSHLHSQAAERKRKRKACRENKSASASSVDSEFGVRAAARPGV